MNTVKERPIPFIPMMARQVRAGLKTKTRRFAPISDLAIKDHGNGTVSWRVQFSKPQRRILATHSGGKLTVAQARSIIASEFSPHGKAGDRLWVREPWSTHACFDHLPPREITTDSIHYWADGDIKTGKWRPPMFMPRRISRTTLEITDVTVERLHEITEAECIAEGCPGGHGSIPGYSFNATPLEHFRWLWEHLHGKGAWDANPYLWVTSFKMVSVS